MKREELVQMREYKVAQASTVYWIKNKDNDEISIMTAFEDGAAWADEHPKNPWISVEERLPEIDQTQHTKKKNMSIAVLAHGDILHDALGQAYSPSVVRYDYERKDWLYVELGCYSNEVGTGVEITHWMPIPELKKGE